MIGCVHVTTDGHRLPRFLVFDTRRFLLVEKEPQRHGTGVVRHVADLEHVAAEQDKADNHVLDVVVVKGTTGPRGWKSVPTWTGRLCFDDYVTCLQAKKHLDRSRAALRGEKMARLEAMLEGGSGHVVGDGHVEGEELGHVEEKDV